MQKEHNTDGAGNSSLLKPTSKELQEGLDGVFETQATMRLLCKRLCTIGDNMEGSTGYELSDLSRVADICVRTLNEVAELIDRMDSADRVRNRP